MKKVWIIVAVFAAMKKVQEATGFDTKIADFIEKTVIEDIPEKGTLLKLSADDEQDLIDTITPNLEEGDENLTAEEQEILKGLLQTVAETKEEGPKTLLITPAQFALMQKVESETAGFNPTVANFIEDNKENFPQDGKELELDEDDHEDLIAMLNELAELDETTQEDKDVITTWVAELEKEPEAAVEPATEPEAAAESTENQEENQEEKKD